jgi:hypothetical protein
MPVEPNERERTAEFRMVFLKLVEDAKRLCQIGNFCEYASLSVIYEEEALHSFSFTLMPAFLTRERANLLGASGRLGRALHLLGLGIDRDLHQSDQVLAVNGAVMPPP